MVIEAPLVPVSPSKFIPWHWLIKKYNENINKKQHKSKWKVLPRANFRIYLEEKPFWNAAPHLICHSALVLPARWFLAYTSGEGRSKRREEEREEAGLPSLFIWFSCSAPLSSVVLRGGKIALSHFRSLGFLDFSKAQGNEKKNIYILCILRILQSHSHSEAALHLRNCQSLQLSNTKLTQTDCSLPMISYKPPLLMK